VGTGRKSSVGYYWLAHQQEAPALTVPFSDNASEALNEYLQSIGGREKLYEDSANALKTKKRGRPSSSTPQASGKRSRRNGDHPADEEPPLSAKAAVWKPPPGSWEEHIDHLDACEDELSGNLMVYLTWKNGHKTQHPTKVIYQRCPQKVCFMMAELLGQTLTDSRCCNSTSST
jgi:chromobox protein 1